ncbi:MAG: (Na+)-NQR maturation NqrM [Cellvibrionaceae bacterium]
MMTFVLTFIVLLLVVAGMAIGSLMGGNPIKGSCGGMSAIGMDTVCDICGGDPNQCDEEVGVEDATKNREEKQQSLAYQAKLPGDE